VTVGDKMAAKESVGTTEAADPGLTKTRQSMSYSAGLSPFIWTKIIVGLQLTNVVSELERVWFLTERYYVTFGGW